MKIHRPLVAGTLLLLSAMTASTFLPAPAAQAQLFGRVKARQSRQSGLWEIVNSTNSTAVVRYAVATRGTSDWRAHKAFVPANSTRLLGYDTKTYDFKLVSVDKLGY